MHGSWHAPFFSTRAKSSYTNGYHHKEGGTAYGRVREQIADAKAEVEELKLFPASTSDGSAYKAPGTF